MSWVTWRQHRQEAVIGLGLLLLIGGYLVLTGLSMYHTAEQWHFFSVPGFVRIAYGVFSLGLGLAVGVVLRRTVAAMAATLVLFIGFRAAIQLIRPWFLSPSTKELDFVNPAFPHDALLVSVGWV